MHVYATKLLATLGLCALLGGCKTDQLEDHLWRQVTTEHFTLISDTSGERSVQLARELERFRAAVLMISGAHLVPEPVPTKIFLFSNWGSYFAYTGGSSMLGFTYPTLRANYLVISPGVFGTDPKRIIFHEYVHYLLGHQRTQYPTWFDEGLAEFMSDVQESPTTLTIGNIPREGINAYAHLWKIPLREIMADDFVLDWRAERVTSFYAQSWATVSYLMSRQDSAATAGRSNTVESVATQQQTRREQLQTYIELLNTGTPRARAFSTAFNCTEAELTGEIRRHLRRRRLPGISVAQSDLHYSTAVQHALLAPHQVAAHLGELTLLMGSEGGRRAEALFQRALSGAPGNGVARAGLAVALAQQQRYAEALAHARRSVLDSPDVAETHLDLARVLLGICAYNLQQGSDRDCQSLVLEARRRFERSLQLAPSAPEAHAGMGMALARLAHAPDRPQAIKHLTFAYDLSRWLPQLSLELAKLYLKDGRAELARESLTNVIRWAKSEGMRHEAEGLLKDIAAQPAPAS